jgi:putative DNA primase/helicase
MEIRTGALGLDKIDMHDKRNEDILFKKSKYDAEGHATCLIALAPNNYLYSPQLGWLRNIGTHWDSDYASSDLILDIVEILKARRMFAAKFLDDDDKKVANFATRLLTRSKTEDRNINLTIKLLKSKLSVNADQLDNEPSRINTVNGVVNLTNGKLEDRPKDHRFTYCLQVEYDPNSDYTAWHEWIAKHVLGGVETANFLQRAAGYSITSDTSEETFFYLYGINGRNGKGTFLETIRKLLGDKMSAGLDAHSVSGKRNGGDKGHDLARLRFTRFLNISEVEQTDNLSRGWLKNVIGGGTIKAAQMYQSISEFKPIFKVWIDSNFPITANGRDDAFWARVVIVTWPISYSGKADPRFKQGMLSNENLKRVFKWLVDGAVIWHKHGLKPTKELMKATKDQKLHNDSIGSFLEDSGIEVGAHLTEHYCYSVADLTGEYLEWCEEERVSPVQGRKFSSYFKSLGAKVGREAGRELINGVQTRVYRGVRKIEPVIDTTFVVSKENAERTRETMF